MNAITEKSWANADGRTVTVSCDDGRVSGNPGFEARVTEGAVEVASAALDATTLDDAAAEAARMYGGEA